VDFYGAPRGEELFLLELGYTVPTFVEWGKLVRIIWEF
jgi:hypothetical protein